MAETVLCPSCGVAIPVDASSCAFCGTTIQTEQVHKVTNKDRAALAMYRYRDGYLHARTIDGFGATIKAVALLIGFLLAFGGIIACAGSSNSFGGIGEIGGVLLVLGGLLIGGFGYILGVLVQSAGQSMKAHFDCAVNGSHFLNDDQRAEVMSLK